MLYFTSLTKYDKLESPWTFSDINIPNGKKDDLLFRLSVPEENSFYHAVFYDKNSFAHPANDRVQLVEDKKTRFINHVNQNVFYQYFEYLVPKIIQEFDQLLDENVEFENLDFNEHLFNIVRENLIQNKDEFMKLFYENIKNVNDLFHAEKNSKNIQKIFTDSYLELTKEEIENISNSNDFSLLTKTKYMKELDETLQNILSLMVEFAVETYKEEIYTQDERNTSPHELYMTYEQLVNEDLNLLITKIEEKDNKLSFQLLDDIPFDKYINMDNNFIVLLYYPKLNLYERIIYDSFQLTNQAQQGKDYIEQAKKYPYKFYTFSADHPLIINLLDQR